MKVNTKLLVEQTVGLFLILDLALFLPAGTLAWPAGWAWLLLFFGFFLGVNFWLLEHDPGLLEERLHLGASDQEGWDRFLFRAVAALPIALVALASADAMRFRWSYLPPWVQIAGAVLLLFSFYLLFLTFRENSYLSPVVRLQRERGQEVITTGPYRYVRHPMYAGIVAFAIATPLMLGSGYAAVFGLVLVILIARRAVLEERTLQRELPGYSAYAARVRYHLIPGVW